MCPATVMETVSGTLYFPDQTNGGLHTCCDMSVLAKYKGLAQQEQHGCLL